jgi:predicted nuclease with TOPRIM domain
MDNSTRGDCLEFWNLMKDTNKVDELHNECIQDLTKGLKYLAEFIGKQGEKITRLENRVELLQDKVNLLERYTGLSHLNK